MVLLELAALHPVPAGDAADQEAGGQQGQQEAVGEVHLESVSHWGVGECHWSHGWYMGVAAVWGVALGGRLNTDWDAQDERRPEGGCG